jgi:Second Messenger Oligonucleotide or Dinucleotide Synthetase domain
MELNSYFSDFLQEIRPTDKQKEQFRTAHTELREKLNADDVLSPIIVSDFLQGSYRRATAVRPSKGCKADVDVILVTKLSNGEFTPAEAMQKFVLFLDKHYKDAYEFQSRSIGIESEGVDLDLVITAAPSEQEMGILKSEAVTTDDSPEEVDDWRLVKSWVSRADRVGGKSAALLLEAAREPEWKLSPLLIPDRDRKEWERTHPLAQIKWTWEKNKACGGHYVNVVKAVKWWRRVRHAEVKHPKGYPLEHLIGVCCPDGITSVAEGVTQSLEAMVRRYESYAKIKQTPSLWDHGVPEHNVLHRISGEDFSTFLGQVADAAKIARRALDADTIGESAEAWQELFGDVFPKPPGDDGDRSSGKGGYTKRTAVTSIGGGRWG